MNLYKNVWHLSVLLLCKTEDRQELETRSIGTPQKPTICSPSPNPHPGSFYSPMLHYWGVRYHTCAWASSNGCLKTSVSACTGCHCLRVKLRETVDLDAREHDVGVFVSMFRWWTWNQAWKSPQVTCELLPRWCICPSYFGSAWHPISTWNHSWLKSQAPALRGRLPTHPRKQVVSPSDRMLFETLPPPL